MSIQSIRSAENSIVWFDLESVIKNFLAWDFFRGQTILVTGGNGLLPMEPEASPVAMEPT